MSLTPEETARYQRHLTLPDFGPAGQERLRSGRVLVIGAGGLGCPALLYLAAAGVGRLTVADADRVEISNLQRQVLYATAEAGQPKAAAAARRLRALNPHVEVVAHEARFGRANALALVRDHDVVLDGSDNFATRYLVNDACVLADRPFVFGAVHGHAGQVSVFNWNGGPTYRCLFPEPPAADSVPTCAEAGVLGVLPGLVGTVQATEAIKLLTGLGEPLSGRLLLWDARTMAPRIVRFAAQPASRQIRELPPEDPAPRCPADAGEWTVAEARAAIAGPSSPQVVDVREEWERRLGAIPSDVSLPWSRLRAGKPPLALEPTRLTVVYCAGGIRSRQARDWLRERHGFTRVLSLRGGYQAWRECME